ncbi:MAG TPA: hydroxyisourate hydrolase [Roseiflexaceae bacterium]|nr:hydroxyisourate hydrolase [Roseiflexaceae bacterium]
MNTIRRPSISTHVLDTERGEPAEGVPVTLSRWDGQGLARLSEAETNQDGRIADLLDQPLEIGAYQLAFDVAAYFRELDGDVPFLSRVTIDFEILDSDRHYHIPLLLSRYACSSYRGS